MSDEPVWYVAYGSNVSGPRLQQYLDRCTDPSPPRDGRSTILPHHLVFARSSRWWDGGGVCFLDPTVDPDAGTLAMAWLLGADQFLEVLAQENGQPVGTVAASLDGLPQRPGDTELVHGGWYGLVLGVESPDDRPALTFTTNAPPMPDPTTPSSHYVETIVDGLVAGHGLSENAARDYLAARGA
jgi:hypothetical protein